MALYRMSGVRASFGGMLLLIAIHFHSSQMTAINDLVSSTLGMKVIVMLTAHWCYGRNPRVLFDMLSLNILFIHQAFIWLGSLTVTCRTCNPEVTQRRRFDSAPGHYRVTTLGKLFTHVPLSPSSIIWYRLHCWDVYRHTAQYTGLVSVVSQCKNWCLAKRLRKWRSAPPYGP